MIYILLGHAALELIPKKLWNHPQIKAYCKKRKKRPSECLLDYTYHWKAMMELKNREQRGRPDIVHICLLNALDSILNKERKLKVFIYTQQGFLIEIKPETRVPRNYDRFKGLIEDLFKKKYVPNKDNWLLKLEKVELKDFVQKFDYIILLDEEGERREVKEIIKGNTLYIIGAFPHGKFPKEYYDLANEVVSIYPKSLSAWVVLNEIIIEAERKFGILQ